MDAARLKTSLVRELRFLENSSTAFDAGYRDEAIRIATAIRVLIHQTPNSTSLLTLFGARDTINLVTTVKFLPYTRGQGGLGILDGVTTMRVNGLEPNPNSRYSRAVAVEEWWSQLVLVSGPESRSTRKSIVLVAANNDGGVHVDPKIDQEYQDLISGLWTLTRQDSEGTETRPMTDHQFIALRQFAHELLNSTELLALAR